MYKNQNNRTKKTWYSKMQWFKPKVLTPVTNWNIESINKTNKIKILF